MRYRTFRIALPLSALLAALASATFVTAAGPQITVDPPTGDCSIRPTVHGTGFPPNTPLELDEAGPDLASGHPSQAAVDVEFYSDASGSFQVQASTEFDFYCSRNRVVKIMIGPDRFPDGHRADIASVIAWFNGPTVASTGSGARPSGPGSRWMVPAGSALLLLSAASVWLATRQRPG